MRVQFKMLELVQSNVTMIGLDRISHLPCMLQLEVKILLIGGGVLHRKKRMMMIMIRGGVLNRKKRRRRMCMMNYKTYKFQKSCKFFHLFARWENTSPLRVVDRKRVATLLDTSVVFYVIADFTS